MVYILFSYLAFTYLENLWSIYDIIFTLNWQISAVVLSLGLTEIVAIAIPFNSRNKKCRNSSCIATLQAGKMFQ